MHIANDSSVHIVGPGNHNSTVQEALEFLYMKLEQEKEASFWARRYLQAGQSRKHLKAI